jgi:type IV pilus assembly protein PilY1
MPFSSTSLWIVLVGALVLLPGPQAAEAKSSRTEQNPPMETMSVPVTAPANVHFLLDTSGSMQELAQVINSRHSEFFAITVNGCENPRLDAHASSNGWNPSFVYPVPDPGTGLGSDTGFPNLFQDSKYYGWMNWASSSNPTPQWNTKENACEFQVPGGAAGNPTEYARCLSCLNTKGYYLVPGTIGRDSPPLQNNNFIFWGRHLNFNPPKYVTARAVLKSVIKDLQNPRVGLSHFSNTTPNTVLARRQNAACDQALASPTSFDSYRASYIDSINGLTFNTATPLGRSLLNIGFYFTSDDGVYRDVFGFGSGYSYPASFRNDVLTSQNRSVCWGCQVSAAVIITDGEPSSDTLSSTVRAQIRARNGGPVYCPDSAPCGVGSYNGLDKGTIDDPSDPNRFLDDNNDYYLDDVAKLLYEQDLQRSSPSTIGDFDTSGKQSLTTYTVGFGIQSNFLINTAAVGGGLYYSAYNSTSLRQALQNILVDVQTRANSCTLYQSQG